MKQFDYAVCTIEANTSVDVLTRLYQDVESDCKSEDDYLQNPELTLELY